MCYWYTFIFTVINVCSFCSDFYFWFNSSLCNTTIVSEVWGDGFKTGSEQWDDGNTADGDGWRSNWSQEFGWTWSGGSVAAKDTCQEIWGDGRRFNSNSTYWDDHNTNIGDGCSSTWTVEAGWSWSGGNSNSKDTWQELWGDGKRFNSNSIYWDDNNTASGDGCNSVWFIETGWICFGGSASNKDTCLEVWGDGKRFNSNSTYWDDGNIKNSDGCNSICFVETGYTWSGGNSNNKDTWNEIWGDGIRFNSNVTYWDDNNTASGDGWSSTWLIETGWICAGGSLLLKDTWHEIWGDGIRFNLNITYWDDNNIVNSDGCSSSWIVETGWSCTGGSSSSQDIWREIWGDGKRFNSNSTYWDDENIKNSDGCNSICFVETGYTWSGGNSNNKDTWNEIWGDGIRFNSNVTYWDDNNTASGDGWSSTWLIETGWICAGGSLLLKDTWHEIWGDGIRFNLNITYWDDNNIVNSDGCSSSWIVETGWSCTGGSSSSQDIWREIWGDGKRFNSNSTYWDDENIKNSDGCSSICIVETGYTWSGGNSNNKDTWNEIWGDGIRFNSNQTYWDDGNIVNRDGCTSNWSIETGWTCSGGSSTTSDVCKEVWGDGIKFNTTTDYYIIAIISLNYYKFNIF